jgi:hypothetical protein
MRHFASILLAAALLAAAPAVTPTQKSATPQPAPCSSYRPHMLAARNSLARGDRAKAIRQLTLARDALESCRRLRTGSRDSIAMAR